MKCSLLIIGFACLSESVALGTPAFSITTQAGDVFNNGSGFSLGFEFSISAGETVDSLGYFAPAPLVESHEVGIYSTSGTLLVSTLVTTSDPITSEFAYQSIAPYALAPGTYWIMGASGYTDPYAFDATVTALAGFTYLKSGYNQAGSALLFPSVTGSSAGAFFGPNFQVGAAAPEPITTTPLLLTAGLIAFFVWRKRRNAK